MNKLDNYNASELNLVKQKMELLQVKEVFLLCQKEKKLNIHLIEPSRESFKVSIVELNNVLKQLK